MIITEQNAFVGVLWPENATVEEMQDIIRRMYNSIDELRESGTRNMTDAAKYRDQVARWEQWALSVVETADEEAEEREWCETYEIIRDRLTSAVPTPVEFPAYGERDYVVTWGEDVTFRLYRSTTVKAKSPENAIQLAAQDDPGLDFDCIKDAYQYGNYETIDTSDWEAEEE